MSKSLVTRLSALEALREGQESPRRGLVGIRGVDNVIRADMPHPMEPEFFTDAATLEARADELGLRCVCVAVINGRKEKAPCAA